MKRALLLACGTYEDEAFVPLRYPLSDVGSVEALLKDEWLCRFDPEDVEVLRDPKKAQAHRAIERLTSQATRDDFILLYFSGHGKLSRNGSVSMVLNDTESEFLHSTGILDDDLRCMFNQSRAGQKMIVLDCCHSGAAGEEGFKRASEDAIEALAQQVEGTFILSASTKFQPAFEQAELKGSVLTRCLIEGVRTGAAAAKGSDIITLSQLGDYLVREVPRHSAQQPKFWDHGGVGAAPFARAQKRLDREWADETVKRLGGLLSEDVIDDETFDELRTVLRADISEDSVARLKLIDDLVERKLAPIVFARRWAANGVTKPVPAAAASTDLPASAEPQPKQVVAAIGDMNTMERVVDDHDPAAATTPDSPHDEPSVLVPQPSHARFANILGGLWILFLGYVFVGSESYPSDGEVLSIIVGLCLLIACSVLLFAKKRKGRASPLASVATSRLAASALAIGFAVWLLLFVFGYGGALGMLGSLAGAIGYSVYVRSRERRAPPA